MPLRTGSESERLGITPGSKSSSGAGAQFGGTASVIAVASYKFPGLPFTNLTNPAAYTSFDATYTLGQNRLKNGSMVRIRAWGNSSVNTNTQLGIKARIQGQAFATCVSSGNVGAGNSRWDLSASLVVDGVGNFYSAGHLIAGGNTLGISDQASSSGAITLAAVSLIDIQAIILTPDPLTQISLDGFVIEIAAAETVVSAV